MQTKVLDLDNNVVGEIGLNPTIYQQEARPDILHRVVEWQRAKKRKGTHKTKGVSEVSGTTRKPYKQKGTGQARQGSLRSPQFRGGGIIFGPVVRSHEYSLQKKVRNLGIKIALSMKLAGQQLIVLKDLEIDSNKTKELAKKLKVMGINSALIIGLDKVRDTNFIRSYQNIKHIDALPTQAINVYDILKHEHLILTREAVDNIEQRLA
jgi:large subunit ribosomal protein L4